jgi:hypothetical protein
MFHTLNIKVMLSLFATILSIYLINIHIITLNFHIFKFKKRLI